MEEPLIFGTHDAATVEQLKRCITEDAKGVLCADGHLGYSMPIGGVVAYQNYISPSGVGYDIACGNLAVSTGLFAKDINRVEMERIADEINKTISFGVGRANAKPVDAPHLWERIATSPVEGQRKLLALAQDQLGTVGSGNHYVDILEDSETGELWIGVHFGSRGFGHKTATGFLSLAAGKAFDERTAEGEMHSPPVLIELSSQLGQDYIEAMKIAGEYAYAGREAVVAQVLNILGAEAGDAVHNHHNFAWNEIHGGKPYWVVRKGATPAFPGQRGFIGGSMGDICVIVRGVDSPEARKALYSTVHGAGRIMSRRQAKGKTRIERRWKCLDYRKCDYSAPKGGYFKEENGPTPKCPKCGHKLKLQTMERQISEGKVNYEEEKAKITTIVRGGGADEAPPVYRKLNDVLEAHDGTIAIERILVPRIVVMAGHDVFDPYKD